MMSVSAYSSHRQRWVA